LEAEEGKRIEDVDTKGAKPSIKLPKYILSRKGKAKIIKDPNSKKFTIVTPLLTE